MQGELGAVSCVTLHWGWHSSELLLEILWWALQPPQKVPGHKPVGFFSCSSPGGYFSHALVSTQLPAHVLQTPASLSAPAPRGRPLCLCPRCAPYLADAVCPGGAPPELILPPADSLC